MVTTLQVHALPEVRIRLTSRQQRWSMLSWSHLARTVRGVRQFNFSLTHTEWFGEEVLWLAPKSPARFVELTAAVTRVFPGYPPYGGLHDGSVPHSTVGDSAGYEELQQAQRIIGAELPLSGTTSAVTVLVESSRGRWCEETRVPFSSGQGETLISQSADCFIARTSHNWRDVRRLRVRAHPGHAIVGQLPRGPRS